MSSDSQYTILFVDDEPWLSEPLRFSLEGLGFQCLSTQDASEAWDELEEGGIDVVVTDIMMPGGELFQDVNSQEMGYELIRRIRVKWKSQAIICLSVIGDVERIQELKKQNVLYLRKGETPLQTAINLIKSKATGKISFY
jgi:CheY-like chemotaxis protein